MPTESWKGDVQPSGIRSPLDYYVDKNSKKLLKTKCMY